MILETNDKNNLRSNKLTAPVKKIHKRQIDMKPPCKDHKLSRLMFRLLWKCTQYRYFT